MEKLSITEMLAIFDSLDYQKGIKVSFDNCYSSKYFEKIDKMYFLELHNKEESYLDKKVFYQKETFKPNYYNALNNIKVSEELIDTTKNEN